MDFMQSVDKMALASRRKKSHGMWVWVNKPAKYGPQILETMFPFSRLHFGYLFLTHTHVVAWSAGLWVGTK